MKFEDALIVLFVYSLKGLKKSFKKMDITKLSRVFTHIRFLSFCTFVYCLLILAQYRSVDEDYGKNLILAFTLDIMVASKIRSVQES